ncbi:MAG: hypothetical protein H6609_17995 [Ignavibacteriales bacterium]|nr:hypothetical protein [Ignavibacteriales bacterium]
MKIIKLLACILIFIMVQSCCPDIVKITQYEKNILDFTHSNSNPHIQSFSEINTLMQNRVKTMTILKVNEEGTKQDSLTYVEFDFAGRIKRRSTIENTTQGCLNFMIRQEFKYEKDKLKEIRNYTFKNKANSVLNNWMETDTTKMKLFDWESYTYKGDTIIVESGYAIFKFLLDENKNIFQKTIFTKFDKNTDYCNIIHTGSSILSELDSKSYQNKILTEYSVEENKVLTITSSDDIKIKEENIFNANGLLVESNIYENNLLLLKRIISYKYY